MKDYPECKCGKYNGRSNVFAIGTVCDQCLHTVALDPQPVTCSRCHQVIIEDLKQCECGNWLCGQCWLEHDFICESCEQDVIDYLASHPGTTYQSGHLTMQFTASKWLDDDGNVRHDFRPTEVSE